MTSAEQRRAAFIDRDGVINAELAYVHQIADFHILPGVFEALRLLSANGFELVIVTNQAGIARGFYTEANFQGLTQYMLGLFSAEGIAIRAIYHCPHHPRGTVDSLARECNCRKPAPGMLLAAAVDHSLDLTHSVIVGDKPSDIQAGRAAAVALTVLVESGHALPANAAAQADHCCADLLAAARWICAQPLFRTHP